MEKRESENLLEILLKLEAKQVLRGFKSKIFPEMSYPDALEIRKRRKENESKNY